MNTYYLYHEKKTKRVVLNTEIQQGSTLIKTIEAESWLRARLTIGEFAYDHVEGHGYF